MKHLILGNGPAGVVAAETLRKVAPADDILMVGFEDAPPYSRMAIPYLLEGNIDESGTYLRKGVDHFERLRIRQLRGRAVALDTAKRKVLFDDGHFEHYDRLLIATQSALDADGDVLAADEREHIDALMNALRATLTGDSAAAIESASEALAKGTEAFAAERMNRGIRQALAGKNVQAI